MTSKGHKECPFVYNNYCPIKDCYNKCKCSSCTVRKEGNLFRLEVANTSNRPVTREVIERQ